MNFPEHWPPHCPPDDAQDAQGVYFRVVADNLPTADSFKSYAELGLATAAHPCKRLGLSVLRTLDDAIHQTRLFPKHGRYVCRADLAPEHGKTLATRGTLPTHTTWWPFLSVDRVAPFAHVHG